MLDEASGIVTGWRPGWVILNRRREASVPASWAGLEPDLMGCAVRLSGEAVSRRVFRAAALTLEPAPWDAPVEARTGWRALNLAIAWLRAAGWPGLATTLARLPARDQTACLADPYRLIGGRALTFQAADFLAVRLLGVSPLARPRLLAAVHAVVREAYLLHGGGLPVAELPAKVAGRLRLDRPPAVPEAIPDSIAVRHGDMLYDPELDRLRRDALARLAANQQDLFGAPEGHEDPVLGLVQYRYAVLTGAAGSGKTTALVRLADRARRAGLDVQLCAMTGKAACVLGQGACTVHRLLGYQRGRFLARHLPADLVIVDEASMLTWPALQALLRAARGKIVFCGDPAQLPPISGESVFRHLLDALPVLTLTTAYRFLGAASRGWPVTRVPHASVRQLLANLVNLVTAHWSRGSVQVLSPVHFSAIGTRELNRLLQARLNPHGGGIGRFRVGDRVIITRNCYESAVYNGESGVVAGGEPDAIHVRLDRGPVVTVKEDMLDLAYCLTVHKAQGSQYDVVVCVLPKSKLGSFCDDALEYVACTRARRQTYCLEL